MQSKPSKILKNESIIIFNVTNIYECANNIYVCIYIYIHVSFVLYMYMVWLHVKYVEYRIKKA